MSNIQVVPQGINLPAHILAQFGALSVGSDDLSQGVSAGFPIMSIRGAKWRIVEGGEEKPIYIPGTTDLAPSVKVVILRANPAVSKTYYAGAFVEGSDEKPDCFSHDGVVPSPEATKPQSTTCATCPQNVWGSKISPSGSKIKACADLRRVAILPAEDLEYSPVLLRIPAASLGDLAQYGKALKQRGIPYTAVVTKLSFDPDASYPKIMFTFERVLSESELAQVLERMKDPVIDDVLGLSAPRGAAPLATPASAPAPTPVPAAEPIVVQPPVEAPAAAAAAKGKGKTKGFGAAAAAAPATPAGATVEPAAVAPGGDIVAGLNAALAKLSL